ncbi:unnamed protein product [Spodoptera exigua]|nr:unnamed protein product [Spodoptera exigua]
MEENNSDDDNLNDLSGKSEDDIIEQCERVLKNISESEDKNRQESQELGRSKRMREKSEGSSEDGFVTVIRRKPKRLIRNEENVTVMEFDEINEELNKQDRTRSPIIGSAPQKARKINSNKKSKRNVSNNKQSAAQDNLEREALQADSEPEPEEKKPEYRHCEDYSEDMAGHMVAAVSVFAAAVVSSRDLP